MTMSTSSDAAPFEETSRLSVREVGPPPSSSAGKTVAILVVSVLLIIATLTGMGALRNRLESDLTLPDTLDGLHRNPTLEAQRRATSENLSEMVGADSFAFAIYGGPDRVLVALVTNRPLPERAVGQILEQRGGSDPVIFDNATCGRLPDERFESQIVCVSGGVLASSLVVEAVPQGQGSDLEHVAALATEVRP